MKVGNAEQVAHPFSLKGGKGLPLWA
jgi:hypothetical protein